MPFTPLSVQVFLKYWKIDPVRAEIVISMKVPANVELGTHYHTGSVVAHTINGAWRYKETDWVARAGDTVYEVAGSSYTPEAFEDTEMFICMTGELLFLDQDNKLVWQEITRHPSTVTPAIAPATVSPPAT